MGLLFDSRIRFLWRNDTRAVEHFIDFESQQHRHRCKSDGPEDRFCLFVHKSWIRLSSGYADNVERTQTYHLN